MTIFDDDKYKMETSGTLTENLNNLNIFFWSIETSNTVK